MNKSVICILILIIFRINADNICEMNLKECPEAFNGSTITVPTSVMRSTLSFHVCNPYSQIGADAIKPSVMFIIDNSGSMSGINYYGSEPTDTAGSRFTVTKTLLDTIYKKFPNAEVGIVIFQDMLLLDTINYKYAVTVCNIIT